MTELFTDKDARPDTHKDAQPDAHEPTPRPSRRRLVWIAIAALAATSVVGGYWVTTQDAEVETVDASEGPVATAEVTRETIADTRIFQGTLGHGDEFIVTTAGQGTVTSIAEPGSLVERGMELFRIDERPTTAMLGTVPMYRDLRAGDSGTDVEQFETSLAELGYDGFTVDDQFTDATAAAVERWQADRGLEKTGRVAQADIVFIPAESRIDAIRTTVGARVSPGSVILDLTGSSHVVSLEVDVRNRSLLETGKDVSVRLPGGDEVTGSVTASDVVAESPAAGEDAAGADDTLARIEVTLDESVDEALLGAPADVIIEVNERIGVLTVPVNALLALAEGGHGLEVVAEDGTTSIVPVETGLFASGRVEIAGDGIFEGTTVGVAGR